MLCTKDEDIMQKEKKKTISIIFMNFFLNRNLPETVLHGRIPNHRRNPITTNSLCGLFNSIYIFLELFSRFFPWCSKFLLFILLFTHWPKVDENENFVDLILQKSHLESFFCCCCFVFVKQIRLWLRHRIITRFHNLPSYRIWNSSVFLSI